ncbi:MAG: D-alanyl-D-alanine carboxypeptidase [Ruminobacter sp.]|uniref:D-alanyl-D-alanine carboxypeptidase family protein n=1 Tax=Ruminobacter TaxID=866 RepID=UPI0015A72080|nr:MULTISPECIES: D-alanyl-D-alanine carboxypeptidase family protein [Ruminobacter]MBQ3774823.1 D-alanyl-D-alanine carboxypeptidase [Ruminobacter sp.]
MSTFIASVLLAGSVTAIADATVEVPESSTLPPPAPSDQIPEPPSPNVRAYLLMDYASGRVLFGKAYEDQIDPASLTKMMTSYVIGQEIKLGRLHLNDMVTISEKAWSKNYSDSSKMFIEVGREVPVELLNKGIIIASGNDACIAMAEHIAGSESSFASLMNEWAKIIGLKNSHFVNSHGLYDENHYSTAYDMALLGRALIKDLPEEYAIYSEKEFSFNGIKQYNRNKLLWDTTINADGIKTGHLSQVGYNLVASAVHPSNGMRLISVIIGDVSEKERAAHSKELLRYGMRFYEPYTAFKQGQALATKEVRLGDRDSISIGTLNDVSLVVPINSVSRLKAEYSLDQKNLTAPIKKGAKIGVLNLSLDGKVIYKTNLVSLDEVNEGGFFSRTWDHIVIFFKDLF